MKKNKLLWYSFIGLLLLFTMPVYAQQPADTDKHWAATEINSAASEGWAYIENGKFSPDKAATREEVVWMLIGACDTVQVNRYEASNKADLTLYKDKPSEWARDRMATAIGNGYIQGYPDNTIKAQANITRAEFSVMLSRLIDDYYIQDPSLPFSDTIPDWSLKGVRKVLGKDIIKGYPDKTFKPNSDVTKAEALVMIKRWKDALPKAAPISEEFKTIISSVKYLTISSDHERLNYYGKEGKTSLDQKEKYCVGQLDTNFYAIVRNFDQETLDSLKDSLKILIPDYTDKVINEVQTLSQNLSAFGTSSGEKTFDDNGRKITVIVSSDSSVFISIMNTVPDEN